MYDSPGSLVGEQIDQFRLDQFLAKGAMGMVYKAFDTVLLRTVAIKLIPKTDAADATKEERTTLEEARKRLILEAKAAGRLTHPSIVTIHCYGETPQFVYICMEYVSGRTLSQVLNERKILTVDEALILFDQILQVLELANREEIVHRDIKPSNIMIGEDDRVKVMDFGIAKLPSLSLTTVGTVLGTPHYMSPEQISGQSVDIRSDIFSVGAVFYEALTGERPFTAETTAALIYKILQVDPIPPRVLNIYVPEAVGDILKKALAKDPAARFQTPTEMLTALRAVSQSRLGSASGKFGTTVMKKMLVSGETQQMRPEQDEVASRQVPLAESPLPEPMEGTIRDKVPTPPPGADGTREVPGVRQVKPPMVAAKDHAASGQPKRGTEAGKATTAGGSQPRVRMVIGFAGIMLLGLVGAIVLWDFYSKPVPREAPPVTGTPGATPAASSQNKSANGELPISVQSLIEQARSLWETDPGSAQKLLEQAVALDPNDFEATFQLARFLTFKKDFPAAIQQYQNALRINNQVPEVFFNLGYIYLAQGALDQAIENYEASRALAPAYLDEILTNLGVCYWKKNDPTQARLLLKQALDLNPNNELARNYLSTLEKSGGMKK